MSGPQRAWAPRTRAAAVTLGNRAGTAWDVLVKVGAVVLGCGLLWYGADQAAPAWRAAHADGVSGMLTITDVNCGGKGGCSRIGDFRSGDDRVSLVGAELIGAGGDVGDRVHAFYEGDRTQVYAHGWRGLVESGLMSGMGVACLGGGAVLPLVERLMLRRRPPTGRHARRL